MLLELLESRRLLSVSLNSSTGLLTVLGTSRDDTVTMSVTNGVLKVVENGRTRSFTATKVKRIHVDGKLGADNISLADSVRAPATLLAGGDTEYSSQGDLLRGGGGNDRLVGNPRTQRMDGGAGNDVIDGSNAEGQMWGGGGNDRILMRFSLTTADGGPGTDTLDASPSPNGWVLGNDSDIAAAGVDPDELSFSNIENWIGGRGSDTIVGSNGRNILRGGSGNDRILARGGNDELYGGSGNDTLDGGSGADALHGEDGNDTLFARDGMRDFLSGGFGSDKAKKDSVDSVVGVESFIP